MNPWLNAILTQQDQDEIDAAVHAINFRLLISRVVVDKLPELIDQRFGDV